MLYSFRNLSGATGLFSLTLLLFGCAYVPQELAPDTIMEAVCISRTTSPDYIQMDSPLTFDVLARWATDSAPVLQEYAAVYRTAKIIADTASPLPNPSVEFGPEFNWGLEDIQKAVPMVGFGFAIPLGDRLSRNDDLDAQKAAQALQRVVIAHRNLYLNLRRLYARILLDHAVLAQYEKLLANDEAALVLFQAMQNSGDLNMLQLAQFRQTIYAARRESYAAETALQADYAALGECLGVSAELLASLRWPALNLPDSVYTVESDSVLRESLLANNPLLAEIHMDYRVADAQYRLELARQYPDLVIGSSYGRNEDGMNTIGLTVGFEIPIFDRNQKAIAEAQGTRDQAVTQYAATLRTQLSTTDRLVALYRGEVRRYAQLVNVAIPESDFAYAEALRQMREGFVSPLETRQLMENYHMNALTRIESEKALFEALFDLESHVGAPLFRFRDESFNLYRPLAADSINDEVKL